MDTMKLVRLNSHRSRVSVRLFVHRRRTTTLVYFGVWLLAGCSRPNHLEENRDKETSAIALPKESSPTPTGESARKDPRKVVDAWNDAHNRHDPEALTLVYAPEVNFYGQKRSLSSVIESKKKAFDLSPDFQQAISNLQFTAADTTVTVTLQKTWTEAGKSRTIGASLKLVEEHGQYFVSEESDAAVESSSLASSGGTTRQGPNWSCGYCERTQQDGPDWSEPNEEADAAEWSLRIISNRRSRKFLLNTEATSVDLDGLGGWRCEVGAATKVVIDHPIHGPEFGIPLWARELYCAEVGGNRERLITKFDCNGRGGEKGSDYFELDATGATVRVELSCSMRN